VQLVMQIRNAYKSVIETDIIVNNCLEEQDRDEGITLNRCL
jgi:hypothetical protein